MDRLGLDPLLSIKQSVSIDTMINFDGDGDGHRMCKQTLTCERSFITVRKRSCGKVTFSQVCVKNSVHEGGVPPGQADTHPPPPIRQPLQQTVDILLECILVLVTARKWSLGQGNIFISVCHSVHRGGSTWPGTPPPGPGRYTPQDQAGTPPLDQAGTHPPLEPGRYTPPPRTRQVHPPDQASTHTPPQDQAGTPPPPEKQTPAYGKRAGGTHPTGIHSCLICYQEGAVEVHNVGGSRCRHPSNRCDRVAAALRLAPLPLPTRHVESPQDVCGKRVSVAYLYCPACA